MKNEIYENHPAILGKNLLNEMKLKLVAGKLACGVDVMTADEHIALAMESGQFAKDVGVHDIAWQRFNALERAHYQFAELLLERAKYIHLVTETVTS